MVVEALCQMRDNRVRSVMVIDDDVLVGIVTQGDCAIKVLLPGLDAKLTPVGQVMTGHPVTVKPEDPVKGCMAIMAARGFRHLPVLDAGKVVGMISIGDVVKDVIRNLEHNVDDLMGYIMRDGPGG
jgi:CBS domain-containing protein